MFVKLQKTRSPNYVCKNNNECVLTLDNRRSCQKCRFDRCVTAGMHPEAVLSDKQKEIRFQKFIQKKRSDISGIGNVAGNGVNTSNESSDKVSISTNLAIVPKSKTVLLRKKKCFYL